MVKPARAHATLALATWLIATPVHGNFCASLVFLAESEQPPLSAIDQTYLKLLDGLGSRLTIETLEKMKGRDPFEIPEQPGTDLDALRKNLSELKRMLEKKEWLDESVSRRLSALVEARVAATKVGGARVAAETKQAQRTTFALPDEVHHHLVDPSGRWVVSFDNSYGGYLNGRVIDLQTRRVSPFQSPPLVDGGDAFSGKMNFSASKNDLLLMTQNEQFVSVPFKDGVLDWKEAKVKGHPAVSRTNDGPEADGRFAFGRRDVALGAIYRQDLTTFKTMEIQIPGIGIEAVQHPTNGRVAGSQTKLNAYGQVPGSDRIWVHKTVTEKHPTLGHSVVHHEIVETYELKKKSLFFSSRVAVNPVVMLSKPSGSHLKILWTEQGELLIEGGKKWEKWTSPEKSQLLFDGSLQKLSLEPQALVMPGSQLRGNVLVQLFKEPFNTSKRWVRTVDLNTGKILLETEAPGDVETVQITPDYRTFLFGSRTGIHLMPHLPGNETP